jgi:hypothetical protein
MGGLEIAGFALCQLHGERTGSLWELVSLLISASDPEGWMSMAHDEKYHRQYSVQECDDGKDEEDPTPKAVGEEWRWTVRRAKFWKKKV